MANPLTGDFEAVVHVSVRQVNGLLATLNQNREIPDASPTFLHSGSVRIGAEVIDPVVLPFGSRFREIAARVSENDSERSGLRQSLRNFPPGVVDRLEKSVADWLTAVRTPANSAEVRGLAQVQVSTPLLSLAEGASDTMIVSVYVRAHYIPDPHSQPLPAPIHGEVWVAYRVRRVASNHRLVVTPPADDSEIQFLPSGSTLTPAEAETIEREVRTLVRSRAFRAKPVDLPPDFPFGGFMAIGSAVNRQNPGDQAIAMPVRLSGSGAPEGSIHSITAPLIRGTDDIGIAVSHEYFDGQLQPLFNEVKSRVEAIRGTFLGVEIVRGRMTSGPALAWGAGSATLSARATLEVLSDIPGADVLNQWVSFSQRLLLVFDAQNQVISLRADGAPSVRESALIDHDFVVDKVVAARDLALAAAAPPLQQVFLTARDQVRRGLRAFDNSASVRFQRLEMAAAGIILRGVISSKDRLRPRTTFRPVADDTGVGYTALDSWIPGGRITRYKWVMSRPLTRYLLGFPLFSFTDPFAV